MKTTHNLGSLEWTVAGWTPWVWRQQRSIESGVSLNAEIPGIPAHVPGSVQGALRDAGILPDWNVALNAREYEWVENRHWIYTARIPDEWLQPGHTVRLRALGLDYAGWILVNGAIAADFTGSFIPHVVDLTGHLRDANNTLQIAFDFPPRWLGQIGYTSQMTEWKPRFNYFWDWTSRLVQTGIWDDLLLEVSGGEEITWLDCSVSANPATRTGRIQLRAGLAGSRAARLRIRITRNGEPVHETMLGRAQAEGGAMIGGFPVELWWPNSAGEQPLYELWCVLVDADGAELDSITRRIGFRSTDWRPCEGAPTEADPWICAVNGQPIFLQGVNWTPIRPNFADVGPEEYRHLLALYRDMGCNLLRVWGGAYLEKEVFYDLCDELGLLVWQEFPLSSSGLDNWPPDDPEAIEEMAEIALSYVSRRKHHASLLCWCGGNELQGPPGPGSRPVDLSHPMIARLAEVVAHHDPGRRFLPSSSSGPRFGAEETEFGQGLHWDVHGPWHVHGGVEEEWLRYWQHDDALFRSEVGVSGASPVDIIREYKGNLPELPCTRENPLWRRTSWWIEWPVFIEEHGREPESLDEYVAWSQKRQSRALSIAAAACKNRFPRCGGFIVWMGHDSFPCTANTAIVDFHDRPKPAAHALAAVFHGKGAAASHQP